MAWLLGLLHLGKVDVDIGGVPVEGVGDDGVSQDQAQLVGAAEVVKVPRRLPKVHVEAVRLQKVQLNCRPGISRFA